VAFIEMDDKRFFLENLVKENPTSKILVFVRTKVRAERVAKALERVEITSQTMHGSKTQEERSNILDRFKSGQNRILIATDVSARGIDIPNVEFVVNYDLPEIAQNYVHRVGRTGRATQRGKAVSFCSIEEKPILKQIEYFLNAPIAVLPISKTDYEATIDFSEASSHDWQSLIKEHKAFEQTKKKRKKKKR
jgi:ATP-dependent RNA helicase RhlE